MSNIIQEIRSGNKDAVKQVYQEYAKDVYNFAKSITGDHDSALAATKKTFLTLFKNIQNGDEPANLRTAALKIAYDEAYKMAAPAQEEAAPQPAAAPAQEEDIYAEPMFQPRSGRTSQIPPVVEDEYEEEYEDSYEEEEDDFVPPSRPQDADREEVYIPKGGYDTLKIEPVDVDEEAAEMRGRRRRPTEEFDEDAPRNRRRQSSQDEASRRHRSRSEESHDDRRYDDDYYDDDYEEETKPRNKGLFIFCIILNVILILILLWFLGGLLVNLGVLPDIDLGYSWFNAHIYPLF